MDVTAEASIRIAGLGKCYRIYDKPHHRLKQMIWRHRGNYYREFWALRDVSFDLPRGESLGIIGRNGAGKSTLLQMIAGTLTPTEGTAAVSGRVAALLELGSGFNPDFTGRENVYLNGAILGFSEQEIEEYIPRIERFADIGEFIDQPVKFYSSGMFVRLAFSVQALLKPDVLIVDEALSVGDVQFQHKCMKRIKELLDEGVSVLFVTHSTDTVKRFCRQCLWLEGGRPRYLGEAGVAVEKYLAFMRMRDQDAPEDEPEVAPAGRALAAQVEQHALRELEEVVGTVDLACERLFFRGAWGWDEGPVPVRVTSDKAARAGFRFRGNSLALSLAAGPDAGEVVLQVDGVERRLSLYRPNTKHLEVVRMSLSEGEHTVVLGPAADQPRAPWCLRWEAARAETDAPLPFLVDPALQAAGDVERYGSGKGRLTAVELLDYATCSPVSELRSGQRVRLRLHAERLAAAGPRIEFSFIVRDKNRIDLFGGTTIDHGVRLDAGAVRFSAEFCFGIRLSAGSYSILASFVECTEDLSRRVPMDQIDIARVFSVGFDPDRPVWYMFDQPTAARGSVQGGGPA